MLGSLIQVQLSCTNSKCNHIWTRDVVLGEKGEGWKFVLNGNQICPKCQYEGRIIYSLVVPAKKQAPELVMLESL